MNRDKWITQLFNATSDYPNPLERNVDGFYDAAMAIVEPWVHDAQDEESDVYYQWSENNPEQWAEFIKNTLGPRWGELALIINVEGY